VFLFLRKYLSSTPAKSQIAKLEKTVLTIYNELSDHEWAGIWRSISTGNEIICRILGVWRSIVHLAIKKSKHFYYNALSKMEWNIMNHSSKYESGQKALC